MRLPLILLLLIATAPAQEKFYEFQHKGPQPDHLRPVEDHQVRRIKEMTSGLKFPAASLAMLMMDGSVGGCSGVCLAGTIPRRDEKQHPEKLAALKYRLIFSTRPAVEKTQTDGPLKSSSIEVPVSFAIAMQRLWSQLVLESRYRPAAESTLDGKTCYFVSRTGEDFIRGMACSPPEGGVVEKMIKLAQSLEDLKEVEGAQRDEKLEVISTQMAVLSRQFPALNDGGE